MLLVQTLRTTEVRHELQEVFHQFSVGRLFAQTQFPTLPTSEVSLSLGSVSEPVPLNLSWGRATLKTLLQMENGEVRMPDWRVEMRRKGSGRFHWHGNMRPFPNQGSNLCPLHWKCQVSTTGPPGKFLHLIFWPLAGLEQEDIPFIFNSNHNKTCHSWKIPRGEKKRTEC